MIYVTIAIESEIDLTDVPGEVVSVSSVHPYERRHRMQEAIQDTLAKHGDTIRALAEVERQEKDDWIPHTGTECPVHLLDVVEVQCGNLRGRCPAAAQQWTWHRTLTHYRHVTDPDGIPYVYDDGDLPEWAEYLATDGDGVALVYEIKPWRRKHMAEWDAQTGNVDDAGDKYANTRIPWHKSLRRVWRD